MRHYPYVLALSAFLAITHHDGVASPTDYLKQETSSASVQAPFSLDSALAYYNLAKVAYLPLEDAQQALSTSLYPLTGKTGLGEGVVTPFGHCILQETPDGPEATFMIRGTKKFQDFFTDAQITLVPLHESFGGDKNSNALVHYGFQQTALSLQPSVVSILRTLKSKLGDQYQKLKISFTGHSLGGALSALSSIWLSSNPELSPNGVANLTTFGAPSIGCAKTNALLKNVKSVQHFYQKVDPVAQLKASPVFVYMDNRIPLPSQDIFQGSNPHSLADYKSSLIANATGKPLEQGVMAQTLDLPYVNQTVFKVLNKNGHALIQTCIDPENHTYVAELMMAYARQSLSYTSNSLSQFWNYVGSFFHK